MEINGKTFIITGGASGLGEATALNLLEQGANVAIFDLNNSNVSEEKYKDKILSVNVNVTSEESVQQGINEVVEKFGSISGVVNCAGTGDAQRVVSKKGTYPLEQFRKIIDLNLVGTFNVIRLATEKMIENETGEYGEKGVIINTASVAGYEGQIGQTAYSASKAGVIGLTITLARDLAQHGIRVVTIAPGLFKTPLFDLAPEETIVKLGNQVPFPRRLGIPAEFGSLVSHIITNQMINGETIRLDGAIRMGPR